MNVYDGVEVQCQVLLISALDESELVSFTPRPLYPPGYESPVSIKCGEFID